MLGFGPELGPGTVGAVVRYLVAPAAPVQFPASRGQCRYQQHDQSNRPPGLFRERTFELPYLELKVYECIAASLINN